MSKNNPAPNVHVVLYASTAEVEVDCKAPSSNFQADKKLGFPICEDITTENGEFTFSSIPCGQYHIVPRWVASFLSVFSPNPYIGLVLHRLRTQ